MCSLCSRLRRGVLYRVAGELGATKIALGHHRDDILATFFLNLFFGGKLKTMPPKLVSDDGQHVVIRPLAYVRERDLARYAEAMRFPIIPCNLCGSQENLQRKQVERDAARVGEEASRAGSTRSSTRWATSTPSHLLDRTLFDFAAVRATGAAGPGRRHRLRRRPDARARGRRRGGGRSRPPARSLPLRATADARSGVRAVSVDARMRCVTSRRGLAAFAAVAGARDRPAAARACRRATAARRRALRRTRCATAATCSTSATRRPTSARTTTRMTGYDDCATQRNLTDAGRAEARAIGAAIRALRIPVGDVLASPYCRTMETGTLDLRPRHGDAGGARRAGAADAGDRYADLRALLSTPVAARARNVAIASHGNPFRAVAGPPYLAEGEMPR